MPTLMTQNCGWAWTPRIKANSVKTFTSWNSHANDDQDPAWCLGGPITRAQCCKRHHCIPGRPRPRARAFKCLLFRTLTCCTLCTHVATLHWSARCHWAPECGAIVRHVACWASAHGLQSRRSTRLSTRPPGWSLRSRLEAVSQVLRCAVSLSRNLFAASLRCILFARRGPGQRSWWILASKQPAKFGAALSLAPSVCVSTPPDCSLRATDWPSYSRPSCSLLVTPPPLPPLPLLDLVYSDCVALCHKAHFWAGTLVARSTSLRHTSSTDMIHHDAVNLEFITM